MTRTCVLDDAEFVEAEKPQNLCYFSQSTLVVQGAIVYYLSQTCSDRYVPCSVESCSLSLKAHKHG